MTMKFLEVILVVFWGIATLGASEPVADSAGAVPKPKGLAYGGIPHGSISGQLSLYFGDDQPIIVPDKEPESDFLIV